MSRAVRTLPWSLATLLASGAVGCSSYDVPLEGAGFGGEDHEWNEDEDDEPSDNGGEGTGGDAPGADDGADDGGGELPPAPDDEGVDNGSNEEEVCDAASDVTLYLSPDDSNSMSSPVQAREAVLSEWGSVQAIAIRTWEFFNYYDFGYPAAEADSLAIVPSLHQAEGAPAGEYTLQIGISSEHVANEDRAPINITLVLDTSGSMAGEPMAMLKESGRAIASSLRAGDTISIVTWATENSRVLEGHVVEGPGDPELLAAIDALEAGGGTDLHGGLVAGYELAQDVFDSGRINRIVLVSDGGANAGITDIELIAEQAGNNDQDGIYMVGVGVGNPLSYHDYLMDVVTDVGKGASVFIPNADEAWKVFGEDFGSTLDVAARDVRVRLDLPPGFEIVRTSAEEVDTDPSAVDPQHLAPNDAMVFHQTIRTCAPEQLTVQDLVTVTVRYRDAVTFEEREIQVQSSILDLLQADSAPLLKGAAVFAYAESLKAYKQTELDARSATVDGALIAVALAEAALPGDPELAEMRAVLEALAAR